MVRPNRKPLPPDRLSDCDMISFDAYEHITVDVEDRVAAIELNRPEVHNALNTATMVDLGRAFAEINLDRSTSSSLRGKAMTHSPPGRTSRSTRELARIIRISGTDRICSSRMFIRPPTTFTAR